MAYSSIALLTNEAKRRIADMWMTGKSYQVKYFALSSGGHNPVDPTVAVAIDPSATVMPGDPPVFGPEPIDEITLVSDYCPVFSCRTKPGEVVGYVSSVALFAEIVYSSDPADPELGTTFLFAVHNRPAMIFTSIDSAEFDLNVFM
jgi:hypothetical protein